MRLRLVVDIGREAMASLRRNRLRAVLCMLGLSWGIVAVVTLLAYGNGFRAALVAGFKGAFGDGVTVMFGGQTSMQAGGERSGRRIRLRLADAEAVGQLPLIKQWSPEYIQRHPVAWGVKQSTHVVRGVGPSYALMRSQRPAAGRFIDAEDVRLQRRVVFLGSEVARKLFGNVPPVGEHVRINGLRFAVVGVQQEKIQLSSYRAQDKVSVFIPYTTAGQIGNTEYLEALVYQTVSPALDARGTADVKKLLAERFRFNPNDPRAVQSFGAAETGKILDPIAFGLQLVLTFIGVLTLATGGVGVMNIMFVSVQERTTEIGLRKALGARRSSILLQFLLEGIATTVAGGAIGVALSAFLLWSLTPIPLLSELTADATGAGDIHLKLSLQLLTITTGILAIVGLVSTLAPAIRAARLDPIDALRYE